ncbi:MAG: hypothetical protein HKN69_15605, partial [Desulfofustis sp.]|nr:hypothetical protein [Desulfofustis sp.]
RLETTQRVVGFCRIDDQQRSSRQGLLLFSPAGLDYQICFVHCRDNNVGIDYEELGKI